MLWISEWPRSLVYPTFLSPVLLSTGVQRSMSLICTPMRTDQVARDIRKKKTEYVSDASQRARIGQIENASQRAEYQDVFGFDRRSRRPALHRPALGVRAHRRRRAHSPPGGGR